MRYPTTTGVLFFSGASLLVLVSGGAFADDGPARGVAKVDANRDGVVQPEEYPFGDYFFLLSDANGDGVLSKDEGKHVERVDAARRKAQGKHPELRGKFTKADANGDGVVARDEFRADDALFQRFDRDGDGKITWDEGLAFSTEEEIAKVFAEFDGDMSGTISVAEVPDDAKEIVSVADLNRDGEVTGKEAYDFLYNARREAPGKGAPSQEAPERSRGDEATTAKAGKLGVLGVLKGGFAGYDANADGGLAPGEFPASGELFTLLDLDSDRRVTEPELRIRLRFAQRLGERGARLKTQIEELGGGSAFAAAGAEVQALFAAGRYEQVERLLDQIELRIEQAK